MLVERAKTVAKNFAVLSATRGVIWVSTFLLMLFLPRYLGPVNYWRFYLGQSVVGLFSLLIDFGGNYSIAKAVSRDRGNTGHILVDSLGIRAFLWVFVFCLLMAYMNLVNYPQPVKYILLIFGISLLWSTGRTILGYCYSGFELMQYPSYATMAETVFVSAVGIAALLGGVGPVGFSLITVLGGFLSFLLCVKFVPIILSAIPPIDWKNSFRLLKEGIPYFLNTLFGVIYYRIDTVMLSLMVPERVVGWYGASYRFFDSLMFVPLIITGALYPVMTRLWQHEPAAMNRTVQKSLDLIMIAGIPLSVGVFAFSKDIIRFFYGLEGYNSSVLLLKIFAVGNLLVYIDVIIGTVLLASDKQLQLSLISFAAIFVNIGLNYFLITRCQTEFGNGAIGSAIATIVTEFFVSARMVLMLPKRLFEGSHVDAQLKAILGGIVMALFVWMIRSTNLFWIAQGVIASVVFVVSLFVFKTFTPADLALVQNTVPSWVLKRLRIGTRGGNKY
jgi:O-antigen/teichoic acid export membrane protein